MKLRKKLLLGFGVLFVVVLFFGIVSVYYIEKISETGKIALKNNYQSLLFDRDMRSVLDGNDLPLSQRAYDQFEFALQKEEHNITEPGEGAAAHAVRIGFGVLTGATTTLSQKQTAERRIRASLSKIDGLNMQAVVVKNESVRATVDRATLYLGAMGFITFLVLFVLIANFPGFIINPLHEFAEAMREISRKNYSPRLDFHTSNEFAELSKSFNMMAEALSKTDDKSASRVLSEEARIKAIIEATDDAILCVNEKQEILFANSAAIALYNLDGKQINNKPINDFTKGHVLLRTVIENKNPDEPLKASKHGKATVFHQLNLEIVSPNLRPNPLDVVQFSAFDAGMIYILKEAPELKEVG